MVPGTEAAYCAAKGIIAWQMGKLQAWKGSEPMRAFWLGAIGYPLIELAYRRRTHPSMALAGGISTALLRRISQTDRPLWQQALLGGLAITGIEYGIGKVVNRRYRIWDYRHVPLNVQGQICLPFTLAWCGMSAAVLGAFRIWDRC